MSELDMITWNDVNADGVGDYAAVDTNGDGHAETILLDTDFNGRIDAIGFDTDEDGVTDVVQVDTDDDGRLDSYGVDTTGDGVMDLVTGPDGATVTVDDGPPGVGEPGGAVINGGVPDGAYFHDAHHTVSLIVGADD